jgi:hypothetical protein
MDGHCPPGAQTAGKQALIGMVVPLTGTLYGQHDALLPHAELQSLTKVTRVQKHGMLAGMV